MSEGRGQRSDVRKQKSKDKFHNCGLRIADCGFYLTAEPPDRIALLEQWAGKMELEMHLISQEPEAGSQSPARGN